MQKRVKIRYDVQVERTGQNVIKLCELDKTITAIIGLLVTSDKDDLLYYRGSQKIEINNEEYFPENYESKLLMSGINADVNQRYYKLENVSPGNGKIKLTFQDTDDLRTAFTPYRVSLYVDCLKEQQP